MAERILERAKKTFPPRKDDTPEAISKRLVVFHNDTEPIIQEYNEAHLLRRVDSNRSADHVAGDVRSLFLREGFAQH